MSKELYESKYNYWINFPFDVFQRNESIIIKCSTEMTIPENLGVSSILCNLIIIDKCLFSGSEYCILTVSCQSVTTPLLVCTCELVMRYVI